MSIEPVPQARFSFASGTGHLAGVDEAGRGPLAGPVVAAAVILDPSCGIDGLNDSKLLTAAVRAELDAVIRGSCVAFGVGRAEVDEIDSLNILHATMLAMQRAVAALATAPELVLVDGNRCPQLPYPVEPVIGGDRLVPAISAASIIAKHARDQEMIKLDAQYPGYGFAQHKGYGTREHLAALQALGPCPLHRRSFRPVREALNLPPESDNALPA